MHNTGLFGDQIFPDSASHPWGRPLCRKFQNNIVGDGRFDGLGKLLILAVDVQYDKTSGVVAGVTFKEWGDSKESESYVSHVEGVGGYIPGQFYKRELPCILRLLSEYNLEPECIVIDGYVYLDGHAKPGLGKHLYDALHGNIRVIGVAKKPFAGIDEECKLLRGASNKALFITCIGMELSAAKSHIKSMHGAHRIPTMLKKADQLCRQQT